MSVVVEYVVVQSHGNHGAYVIRPCRVQYSSLGRSCDCGNLANTAGHYPTRALAEEGLIEAEAEDEVFEDIRAVIREERRERQLIDGSLPWIELG